MNVFQRVYCSVLSVHRIKVLAAAAVLTASWFGYTVAGFADPLTLVTHTPAQTGPSESFAAQLQQVGAGP